MKLLILIVATACFSAAGAADVAFYNVCAGQIGSVRYSHRAEDNSFLVRCPDGKEEIIIKKCRGALSFDASYNVLVTCPGSIKKIPIIRGPYPR